MGLLDGKVAIVTGGARGVGRGEALLLAEEGASVVVNDLGGEWDGSGRDERAAQIVVDEITTAGGKAAANYDDVADWEGGQRLVNQAIETFGGLDILVCNAGILRDRTIFNMTEDEWDSVIRVHLKGHFVPMRFATAYWREKAKAAGGATTGRIVLTASEAGLYGNAGQTNYSAAKAGIASMAISAAREVAKYGVTVNSICPRARTRMTENTFGAFKMADGQFDSWAAENVAPWVAYLCTDEAAHISGQCFVVGGGSIDLEQGWHQVNTIAKNDRWTVEELVKASQDLFADHSSEIPRFPMMGSLPTS